MHAASSIMVRETGPDVLYDLELVSMFTIAPHDILCQYYHLHFTYVRTGDRSRDEKSPGIKYAGAAWENLPVIIRSGLLQALHPRSES